MLITTNRPQLHEIIKYKNEQLSNYSLFSPYPTLSSRPSFYIYFSPAQPHLPQGLQFPISHQQPTIAMHIRRKRAPIYLRINAFRAADLFLPAAKAGSRSVSACLVALLNGNKKRCRRKLNTPNPSWDDEIVLPLSAGDASDVLVLAVWNWAKRDRVYLGEVRLRLSQVFADCPELRTDAKWYELYLSAQRHEYITGSVLLLFEIFEGKKPLEKTEKAAKSRPERTEKKESAANEKKESAANEKTECKQDRIVDILEASPKLLDKGTEGDAETSAEGSLSGGFPMRLQPVEDLLEKISFSGLSLRGKFKSWQDSLILPDDTPIAANEQGFYADLPVDIAGGDSDVSDLESLMEVIPLEGSKDTDLKDKEPAKHFQHLSSLAPLQAKFLYEAYSGSESDFNKSDYTSASEVSSLESLSVPESAFPGDGSAKPEKKKKKRFFRKRTKLQSRYEVRNRKVEGVLFLEIVSCSDLPPIKNFSRTTFDMDPFVVVTFGKTTFRTSWKRHTLKPIYNERLAFEILEHELNYDIHFSVLDKERFSFHEQVGDVVIPIKDMMDIAKEQPVKESVKAPEPGDYFAPNLAYLNESNQSVSSLGSVSEVSHSNPSITFAEDSNIVKTRRKRLIRKHTSILYVDTSLFQTLNLKLRLKNEKMSEKHQLTLKVRARYLTYERLRRDFWRALLEQYNVDETQSTMDYIEFISFLDTLGCSSSDDIVGEVFASLGRSTWGGDTMSYDEIVDALEKHVNNETQSHDEKIFEIEQCPICAKKRLSKKYDLDIITHFAICASKDWSIVNKLLVSSYVTPQVAARRWFSKVLIKLSYGKYQLGGNSANILVQDRSTGLVLEEKMGITVRLGIRLLYKGLDKAKLKRVRALLRKLSVKQGIKFDSPQLTRDIASFILFHRLDLSECLVSDYTQFASFNEFFYRRLKPGARPIEAPGDDRVVVSPADCRTTTFATVDDATALWIKGRNFSVAKLFNGNFNNMQNTDFYKLGKCSVGIFRLAPQDYHRFHSPVAGTIGPIKSIEGEYYTVNPMAIRSDLDVYGENVRVVVPIETAEFGTVVLIAVGAMMVGSTVLTVKEGQTVKRGQEVGYFKFGGSTVLLLFQKDRFTFDSDLLNNSKQCVETLVRVGQSIGHSPAIAELKRTKIKFDEQPKNFRLNLIRVITGGDLDNRAKLSSWESENIKITVDDVDLLRRSEGGDSEVDYDDALDELDEKLSIRSE